MDLSDKDCATIIAALDVFADKMRNYDHGPGVSHDQAYARRQERLESIAAARAAITRLVRVGSMTAEDRTS